MDPLNSIFLFLLTKKVFFKLVSVFSILQGHVHHHPWPHYGNPYFVPYGRQPIPYGRFACDHMSQSCKPLRYYTGWEGNEIIFTSLQKCTEYCEPKPKTSEPYEILIKLLFELMKSDNEVKPKNNNNNNNNIIIRK